MSSWANAKPRERAKEDAELYQFLREVFTRLGTFGSFSVNPGSVAAGDTLDVVLAFTTALEGLRVGQAVYVTPPTNLPQGIVVGGAWCHADGQLTIRLGNVTGSPINPPTGTWAFQGVVI